MKYKFLIIDDSSIVRKSIIKTINLCDIEIKQIYEAENGLEGLKILKSKWVDLVFLDINMPVMNGIEFMAQLRKEKKLANVPVVIISTEGSHERKTDLFKKDIKAFLRKPATPETIVRTVKQVLEY